MPRRYAERPEESGRAVLGREGPTEHQARHDEQLGAVPPHRRTSPVSGPSSCDPAVTKTLVAAVVLAAVYHARWTLFFLLIDCVPLTLIDAWCPACGSVVQVRRTGRVDEP